MGPMVPRPRTRLVMQVRAGPKQHGKRTGPCSRKFYFCGFNSVQQACFAQKKKKKSFRSVGYHKKGYPKQEPKILLSPCKNQTARSQQIFRFARGLAPRPQAKDQKLPTPPRPSRRGPLTEALSPRPCPERPRTGANSPIRSRPGSAKQTRNLRPDRTPLTKRHIWINAPNYSRKCQPHAGTVRAERPTGQGTGRSRDYLPLCSSLCSLLTPVLPCAT